MPRLRFSIREMMLVTLVVGLVIGWSIDHRLQAGRLRAVGTFLSEMSFEYGRSIWVHDNGEIEEQLGKDIVKATPAPQPLRIYGISN